jgi:hypothetical protein
VNCYTAEAVQVAMAHAFWALLMGAALACYFGAIAGRLTYWSIFLFVRRSRRWRRFDRAMRKVMA